MYLINYEPFMKQNHKLIRFLLMYFLSLMCIMIFFLSKIRSKFPSTCNTIENYWHLNCTLTSDRAICARFIQRFIWCRQHTITNDRLNYSFLDLYDKFRFVYLKILWIIRSAKYSFSSKYNDIDIIYFHHIIWTEFFTSRK